MAKKQLLCVLIVLFSAVTHSQKDNLSSWVFKIDAPLLLDDISFPTVQLSVEKKISPGFSIIAEAGYQLYNLQSQDTNFVRTNGYKINLEIRHYLGRSTPRKHPGFFIGLQAFQRENQSNQMISYTTPSLESFDDVFVVERKVTGGNITFGYQLNIVRRTYALVMEPHVGLGFMNRNIRNKELQYDASVDDEDEYVHDIFVMNRDLEKWSGSNFNFNIGFRIGIRPKY